MYLSELIGGLRRRWWAVALGLLATVALTFLAFRLVPPSQEAKASVVILPPHKVSKEAGNPYVVLGGLQPAADMLAAAMNSGQIHDTLAPSDGPATYEVARDTSSSGPMLLVSVSDKTPEGALRLLDSVLNKMPDELDELQQEVNVRRSNYLTVTEITRDSEAEPSVKRQLRATLVAVAGGLAITIFGTNLLDGFLIRRARKRNDSEAVSAHDPPILNAATDEPGESTANSEPHNSSQSEEELDEHSELHPGTAIDNNGSADPENHIDSEAGTDVVASNPAR